MGLGFGPEKGAGELLAFVGVAFEVVCGLDVTLRRFGALSLLILDSLLFSFCFPMPRCFV